MIPFDLSSLDSSSELSLPQKFLGVIKHHLSDTGPTRDLAGYCVATFLVRTDMSHQYLNDFLDWAVHVVTEDISLSTYKGYFAKLGALAAIHQILKRGDRSKLLPMIPSLYQTMANATTCERSLERKYHCKVHQRIALCLLPPKLATWRYSRGLRTLLQSNVPSGPGQVAAEDISGTAQDKEEEDIPEEIEDIVGQLLKFLVDSDTIVRWSAAKGLGRICMRVSQSFGQDIINAVLDVFNEEENQDVAWHGGCLALAELSRRGLILPSMLPSVIPFLWQALIFDSSRRQQSVGANVRDAACYVCWAFARAYPPSAMSSFILELTKSLLITTLYDREINCRRAAAAAFQELVGRQGNQGIPHGIDIIALADYVSIGNRKTAYLSIAPMVAAFDPSYRDVFVDFLLKTNLQHWDPEIRDLSAKALALFVWKCNAPLSDVLSALLKSFLVNDVVIRHGALLGVSNVLLICHLSNQEVSVEVLSGIEALIHQVEKNRMFRGRGGEMIREAVCQVIGAIGYAQLSISTKTQVSHVECLNENLRQPHANVQIAAQEALRNILFHYFSTKAIDVLPSDRLQSLTTKKYLEALRSEENVAVTRGFSLALGALPPRLALLPEGVFDEILTVLEDFASSSKRIGGEYDAETCRNAVNSAVELCEKMVHSSSFSLKSLRRVLSLVMKAGLDYSVDKRGDIGSWSRIAALEGILSIVKSLMWRCGLERSDDLSTWRITAHGPGRIVDQVDVNDAMISFDVKFELLSGSRQKMVKTLRLDAASSGQSDEDGHSKIFVRKDAAHKLCIVPSSSSILETVEIDRWSKDSLLKEVLPQCLELILQQLSEKLDCVRVTAGNVLLDLMDHVSSVLDGNADLFAEEILVRNLVCGYTVQQSAVNWSRPDHAFPFVTLLMSESRRYSLSIFTGLITSVGCITETVSKVAAEQLLRVSISCRDTVENHFFLSQLMEYMFQLLQQSRRKDRVVIPLLKAIDILLKNNIFDRLDGNLKQSWASSMLALLNAEVKNCQQISKICAIMDTQSLLAEFEEKQFVVVSQFVSSMLGHKFPKVRKCKLFCWPTLPI